jgi:hypothetical protein
MDRRHRVYYFINLNQNRSIGGWWGKGYDSYGIIYDKNLSKLKRAVPSLKIMPSRLTYKSPGYYQMKVSCKLNEELLLLAALDSMKLTNYEKIRED